MAKYVLSNKAVEDLSKIWEYTFKIWTEDQADKYYEMLISSCQEIAENPHLGRDYKGIFYGILGKKINRNIIFYRTFSEDYVEIMRILHERMDLKNRIIE